MEEKEKHKERIREAIDEYYKGYKKTEAIKKRVIAAAKRRKAKRALI